MARAPSSSPRPQEAPGRSVEINGRTITDPAQVERIERNREASARYAVDAYRDEGSPIPPHLQGVVDNQIARGVYSDNRLEPRSGNILDLFIGPAPGSTASILGTPGTTSPRGNALDLFTGPAPGSTASILGTPRSAPTPGPNYVAGLGMPGTPREDNLSMMAAPQAGLTAPSTGLTEEPVKNSLTGEEVSRRNAERSRVPTYEEGGMVGPGGNPIRPSTRQRELPPILTGLFSPRQSYAEGGMVGPGGMPQRPMASPMAVNAMQGGAPVMGLAPPGGAARPLNFAAIDMEAQRFMQQNPQQVEQIKAEVQRAMSAGEIDASALNMFVQVATVALQNPDMWPQLRQSLIAQDLMDPEDVGEEYDQGFLIALYLVGKTMGGGQMTTPAPMSAGQEPQMSMREGGPLPTKSENPDGSIPINAHEGEYVIPADVTRKLGTDHFDKLIAKTRGVDAKGEQQ